MAAKFNTKKPFSTVHGDPTAIYMQDGKMFDAEGEFVKNAPAAHVLPPRQEVVIDAVETKDAILARAAKQMGIKQTDPTAPNEIVDAAKENAKARAAEDWEEAD